MQYMWLLGFMIALILISCFDIRSKSIPLWGFVLIGILSVLYILISEEMEPNIVDILVSCIPGVVLLSLSFLTDDKIGKGDAILILELGIGLGIETICYVLTGALIAVFIFSVIMLALKKIKRTSRIAFVPFITFSMGVIGYVFR